MAIGGAHDTLAEDREELIADAVAERVIQVFEAVDIEKHDGDAVGALGAGEGAAEAGKEQRPVGEPGERVVEGAVDEGIGRFLDGVGHAVEGMGNGLHLTETGGREAAIELAVGGGFDDPGGGPQGAGDVAMEEVSGHGGGRDCRNGGRQHVGSRAACEEVMDEQRQEATGQHDRAEERGNGKTGEELSSRGHPPAFLNLPVPIE